jgi:hypothetical protein
MAGRKVVIWGLDLQALSRTKHRDRWREYVSMPSPKNHAEYPRHRYRGSIGETLFDRVEGRGADIAIDNARVPRLSGSVGCSYPKPLSASTPVRCELAPMFADRQTSRYAHLSIIPPS